MERWDLLDETGRPTGERMVRGEPIRPGRYHRVVHVWVMDSTGRLLIQKRAPFLRLMPGEWTVTSGSAVAGEDSRQAAARELGEELGIHVRPEELEFLFTLRRRSSFSDLWLLRRDVDEGSLRLQAEEVADARWVTRGQLQNMLGKRNFHHYGRDYFERLFARLYPDRAEQTLYISDLDGTMLAPDGHLSARTVKMLNTLIEKKGVLVSVATARSLMGAFLTGIEQVKWPVPLVLMNGVLLYDIGAHRILQHCAMPAQTVDSVLDICRKAGKFPFLYRVEGDRVKVTYTQTISGLEKAFVEERQKAYPDDFMRVDDYERGLPAVYFSLQDSLDRIQQIRERVEQLPGVQTAFYRDVYNEGNWFLEIFDAEAGKAGGVRRLNERVGAGRLVAFGDNFNDRSMLEAADVACVVENGVEEMKALADVIVGPNDADGVAEYIWKDSGA